MNIKTFLEQHSLLPASRSIIPMRRIQGKLSQHELDMELVTCSVIEIGCAVKNEHLQCQPLPLCSNSLAFFLLSGRKLFRARSRFEAGGADMICPLVDLSEYSGSALNTLSSTVTEHWRAALVEQRNIESCFIQQSTVITSTRILSTQTGFQACFFPHSTSRTPVFYCNQPYPI